MCALTSISQVIITGSLLVIDIIVNSKPTTQNHKLRPKAGHWNLERACHAVVQRTEAEKSELR